MLDRDPVGAEEAAHGVFEIGFSKAASLPRPLSRMLSARSCWRWPLADVAALPENRRRRSRNTSSALASRCGLSRSEARLGQEQAAPVAQDDAFAERAVLVLLELQLAQVVVGLLAVLALTPLRYCRNRNAPCQAVEPEMPEPEAMPCRLGWHRQSPIRRPPWPAPACAWRRRRPAPGRSRCRRRRGTACRC